MEMYSSLYRDKNKQIAITKLTVPSKDIMHTKQNRYADSNV